MLSSCPSPPLRRRGSAPADLHPVAVAGFLRTPQADLFQGRPMTPVEWLREGGDVDQAIAAAANTDWYTA